MKENTKSKKTAARTTARTPARGKKGIQATGKKGGRK